MPNDSVLCADGYGGGRWMEMMVYQWANGFQVGTGPWAAREYTGSMHNGWKEVYNINPSIVEKAAEYLNSALKYLENLN